MKRILFVTDILPDYLPDLLFDGMVKLLGVEAVDHFPPKPSYAGDGTSIPDILSNLVFSARPGLETPDFEKYDLILLSSRAGGLAQIPEAHHARVIFLDGEDSEALIPGMESVRYVKREYRTGKEYPQNVFPFPFGWVEEPLPDVVRDLRVSFLATETHHWRRSVFSMLEEISAPKVVTLTKRGQWAFSRAEYWQILARSQATLSVPGAGQDTYRFWEGLASGACLISFPPDLVIPWGPKSGVHYLAVETVDALRQTLAWVEDWPEEAQEIGRRGRAWALKHHTSVARARWMMEK